MIERIDDVPAGVIGLRASGKLTKGDYRDVLEPALKEATDSGEARVVFVLPDFDGLEPGAWIEDVKTGFQAEIQKRSAWRKLAFVSGVDWWRRRRACSPGRCPASSVSMRWISSTKRNPGSPPDGSLHGTRPCGTAGADRGAGGTRLGRRGSRRRAQRAHRGGLSGASRAVRPRTGAARAAGRRGASSRAPRSRASTSAAPPRTRPDRSSR
jgi:hypothetical protein